jgi:hypothetical protein
VSAVEHVGNGAAGYTHRPGNHFLTEAVKIREAHSFKFIAADLNRLACCQPGRMKAFEFGPKPAYPLFFGTNHKVKLLLAYVEKV